MSAEERRELAQNILKGAIYIYRLVVLVLLRSLGYAPLIHSLSILSNWLLHYVYIYVCVFLCAYNIHS
jgi:hypothetical protein